MLVLPVPMSRICCRNLHGVRIGSDCLFFAKRIHKNAAITLQIERKIIQNCPSRVDTNSWRMLTLSVFQALIFPFG
jgi:hypothetical protein